ncbi:MAG TPA: hypothetical protein VK498_01345, partial [Ferruginibacter sp.]|nr:hypothetical protein [Ferruginibacter sp.]
NIISYINDITQNTIGPRQGKINVVLQDQTTISNAYVGLGPFRSEFFLTPFQNSFEIGSLPWGDQLAIHEFRHVQQFNNFNVGLSKVFRVLFGEEGQALANGASIPNWFFEGDAVFNETFVSEQGRGRLPFFHNAYRSLWKSGKNYSWMKLRNGSFKDYTPDHYALGYLLVAYGREKYGNDFWKNVTHDAASFKGLFYPFQKAIKKYSGKDYTTFRNEALGYFRKQSQTLDISVNERYQNEEFPVIIDEQRMVFVKSSYRDVPHFVIRTGTKDKKIRNRDVSLDNHFSYNNGKIVYASYRPDIRRGYKDYSEIQLLDIASGKQQTLTRHSKYFSPDISNDGTSIVAAEVAPGGKSSLHLLNASTGTLIAVLPNADKLFYSYPKFFHGDKIISAVRNPAGQMSLAITGIADGITTALFPFSFNVIGFPAVSGDTIYFSASNGNEDKIFAYLPGSKKLFLLIDGTSGIGQYQPNYKKRLVWTTFSANGYRIEQSPESAIQWKQITVQELQSDLPLFGINNLTTTHLLTQIPNTDLAVSDYPKSKALINFHSLEPIIDDPEYKITLVSQNILNTLQSQISFTYNRAEQFKKAGLNLTYGGLFPYLSAGIDYTIDRRALYRGKTIYWNETEPSAGITIPLDVSKGRTFTSISFESRFVYNQSSFTGVYKDSIGKTSFSYSSNTLSFSNLVQKAKQNIFPKFAQTASIGYKRGISGREGWQFTGNLNLYVPGVFKNHNIVLNGAYLRKDSTGQINFSSGFPFSRGYSAVNLYEMIKWGANYHMPLCYPDAGLANIVYLSRIRSNFFYDHTSVNDFFINGKPFTANLRSAGTEVYFDTKWWNDVPVSFGIRYSYLLDDDLFGGKGKNRWEIILPVNLFRY